MRVNKEGEVLLKKITITKWKEETKEKGSQIEEEWVLGYRIYSDLRFYYIGETRPAGRSKERQNQRRQETDTAESKTVT